jgi:glycosyltransferase involved in cell wall biosynthesis
VSSLDHVGASKDAVSVVLPTINAESYISQQILDLLDSFKRAGVNVGELIVVDDRSTDTTIQELKQLQILEPCIVIVRHFARRGLQVAVSTGIDYAHFDYVIICEDDTLYGAEAITAVAIPVMNFECDVVIGIAEAQSRRISSRLFWFILKRLSQDRILKRELMFRCIGPKMLTEFRRYRDSVRTVTGLMLEIGLDVRHVQVTDVSTGRRQSGHSFRDRLYLFVDIFLTVNPRPAFSMLYVSVGLFFSSIVIGLMGILTRFWYEGSSNGYIFSIIGGTLFLSGLCLSISWLQMQFLHIVLRESRNRPLASSEVVL